MNLIALARSRKENWAKAKGVWCDSKPLAEANGNEEKEGLKPREVWWALGPLAKANGNREKDGLKPKGVWWAWIR